MPPFLDECRDLFGTADLYEVLGVSKEATPSQIRRGCPPPFRARAGQEELIAVLAPEVPHARSAVPSRQGQAGGRYGRGEVPSRQPGVRARRHPPPVPRSRRQRHNGLLASALPSYQVLSDEGSKRLYDQTGEVDDGDDAFSDRAPDQSWADYFAERFSSVSAELIEDDRRAYQGSEEEKGDIAAACVARCCAPAGLWGHFWRRYTRHRGDVDRIVEEIPHCSVVDGDDDRIRDIIAGLIAAGALTAEAAFTKESKSKRASRKDSVRRLRAG